MMHLRIVCNYYIVVGFVVLDVINVVDLGFVLSWGSV